MDILKELQKIADAAKADTAKLEQHAQATNEQFVSTMLELKNATTTLSAQVANITTELAGVAVLLKAMQEKVDNAETNKVAPPRETQRTDGPAASGCWNTTTDTSQPLASILS